MCRFVILEDEGSDMISTIEAALIKLIKAGAHGVPGGENMIRFPDGKVRYLTVLEAKRLQTFPDDFVIKGVWGEAMRQIGNAVPVLLAEMIGHELVKTLNRQNQRVAADGIERLVNCAGQ